MQADYYNEVIIRKKKSPKDKIIILAIFAAGFLAIYFTLMNMEALQKVFILIVAAVLFLMYQGLTLMNVEYEYAVTNGEVDIDKIIAQRRRKHIITVDARDFEYFAPLSGEHKAVFNRQDYARKIDVFSAPDASNIYFAYFFKNGEKIRLAFQPTERMIEDFERFVPRSMFHKA